MGGSTLIEVSKNNFGWYYKKDKRVGYYSSLAEVMVDAYREECPTNSDGTSEQRDNQSSDK
mgnify:CR=1 FL=1|tara:strand:+ start:835 stop:1017 length:183 start_codon:yes stop_codon:yes gene_type:complete